MTESSVLINHARVLVRIAHDIAATVGITERSAYTIVTDLTAAGSVVKNRDGSRNRYQVQSYLPPREASTRERTIGEVLNVLVESELPMRGPTHRRGDGPPKFWPSSTAHREPRPSIGPRGLLAHLPSRRTCG